MIKKIILLCALTLGAQGLEAQNLLDLLKNNSSASAKSGQTLGALGDVLADVLGSGQLKAQNLQGTWSYTGSRLVFKSENTLKKAASSLAASALEKKLDTYLGMIGVKPGACAFTFNADNTCTATIGNRKISGTYTIDTKAKTVTLTFTKLKAGKFTAHVTAAAGKMSLLFEADRLLNLVTAVTKVSGNATMGALSGLLGSYDGLMIGLEFGKK